MPHHTPRRHADAVRLFHLLAAVGLPTAACQAQQAIDWVGYQYTCSSHLNFPSSASFFDPQNWLGFVVPSGTPGSNPNLGTTAWFGRMGNPVGGQVPTTVYFGDFCYNPGVGCPGDQFIPTVPDWYVDRIEIASDMQFVFDGSAAAVGAASCGGFDGTIGGISTGYLLLNFSGELTLLNIQLEALNIFAFDSQLRVESSSTLNATQSLSLNGSSALPSQLWVHGDDASAEAPFMTVPGSSGNPNFAEVHLVAGGVLDVRSLWLGSSAQGVGLLEASGAGNSPSTLICEFPRVGDRGNGTLRVLDGGAAELIFETTIGKDAGSSGLMEISGSGSTVDCWRVLVGEAGSGRIEVLDGGLIRPGTVYVAAEGGSTGELVVSGVGSELLQSEGLFWVGWRGSGNLLVLDGGVVRPNREVEIGVFPGSQGLFRLSGPGSRLETFSDVVVGAGGTGTLEVSDDGLLDLSSRIDIGRDQGSSGTVLVDGAGSTIEARSIRVGSMFSDASGNLVLRNGGTVNVSVDIEVSSTSSLRGNGAIRVGSSLSNSGQIKPGDADGEVGTVSLNGYLFLGSSSSSYHADVIAEARSLSADRLAVNGDAQLGGTLDVAISGDSFAVGQQFDVLTAASLAGTFESVNLPTISSTLAFELQIIDTDSSGSPDTVRVEVVNALVKPQPSDGPLSFADETRYEVGFLPADALLGDIDGDGDLDAVVIIFDGGRGEVLTLLNDGSGQLLDGARYDSDLGIRGGHLADLDSDGDLDLLTAAVFGQLGVWFNLGNGTFASEINYDAGDGPRNVTTSDVDSDGDLDVIVVSQNSNDVRVFRNSGSGSLSSPTAYPVGLTAFHVVAADLDGANGPDLIVANRGPADEPGDDTISVLPNLGDGTFGGDTRIPVGDTPSRIDAADLDADGDIDIAVVNMLSNDMSILLNTGSGNFSAQIRYPIAGQPRGLSLADVDLDGDLDAVTANLVGDTVALLANDGFGGFSAARYFPVGQGPQNTSLGDLNGDGSLDLIVPNFGVVPDSGGREVSVLFGCSGCSADLSPDGVLNFFDLSVYLALFNAGDPAADMAEPAGVFNFFDISAYLDAFNAGCP